MVKELESIEPTGRLQVGGPLEPVIPQQKGHGLLPRDLHVGRIGLSHSLSDSVDGSEETNRTKNIGYY